MNQTWQTTSPKPLLHLQPGMRVGMIAGLLHRAVDAVINRMCQLLLLAAFDPLAGNAGLEAAFMAALYICNDIILTNSHGALACWQAAANATL